MNMYSVLSDLISHIEYDKRDKVLTVYLNDGTRAVYHEIPEYKVDLFITAPYPDSFYSANFKGRFHEVILP